MTIDERLEALEREVQRLRDIEEIRQNKAKYYRSIDSKQWNDLRETVSEDFKTAFFGGKIVCNGVEEFVAFLKKSNPETTVSLHMAYIPEITIDSETEAHGRWYLRDSTIVNDGSNYIVQGASFHMDKYEKRDGKWLITEIKSERTFEEMYQRNNPTARVKIYVSSSGD